MSNKKNKPKKRKARFRFQLSSPTPQQNVPSKAKPRPKPRPKPKQKTKQAQPQQQYSQQQTQQYSQQQTQQYSQQQRKPAQRQNQPNKPKPRRRRQKLFKKYSELTPRERETYLSRKQKQLLKQERKLQKSLQKTKANKHPQSKPKKRKFKDPFATDYKPTPLDNQQKRRSKKRNKKNYTLYYILLFIISSITVYCLSVTIWFEIEEIVVVGDTDISYEEIINISGIQIYENLVKLSEKTVSKNVRDEYITIETVELNKKFPNKVEIEVTMATPKALIYHDRIYYTLSQSDRIISFTTSNYHNNDLISFIGGDLEEMDLGDYLKDVDLDYLEYIDRLLVAIDDNQFKGITFVDTSNISDIRFYADGLYEIKAGGFTEISYKLHCANWIINLLDKTYEQKGIIDVSVDNGKYYFRPALEVNPNLW